MSIRQAVHHLREVKYFNDPILTGVNHGFVKSIFGIYGGALRNIQYAFEKGGFKKTKFKNTLRLLSH